MRGILITLAIMFISVGVLMAQLGSDSPTDDQLAAVRAQEGGAAGSGIFDIATPPTGTVLQPVKRVPRERFGIVGSFPLRLQDLDALVFPDATTQERQAMLEGMTFFTTAHTAAEGLGPLDNQPFCLGCHMSSAEEISSPGLVSPSSCVSGSTCVSLVSRAARATPTNFKFTSFDPKTGGGQPAGRKPARCPRSNHRTRLKNWFPAIRGGARWTALYRPRADGGCSNSRYTRKCRS